ncbi:putative tail fiber protein [Rhizobium phage RHph_N28_1]|nr:putative tail fiber protein [Rhizobium phage RHph_N28_1]QIG74153.1 putative tail fiber protein [Rhizobium phage RHph_N42]QXV73811.1 putative tail fiber protein [Rhizobium phage RHph_N46]
MALAAQKIIVRIGMSEEVPGMDPGEMGWDMDLARLRVGDGSPNPTYVMTNKSKGPFEYNFIQYAQYPEIRMLPEGTVDGVDISDLNRENGLVTRIGDNLWAHRTIVNTDGYVEVTFGDGVAGNPTINFSHDFTVEIGEFLKTVAVDDITIHGNGTVVAPLYAQIATFTLRGVIRIATLAEVNAGVDTTTAVCPAYLKNYVTNNSKKFGAILKTGTIYTFPHLQDSGSLSLAGYTCAVVVVSGGGDIIDGGTIRLRIGNVTFAPPSQFLGDNPAVSSFSAGSGGSFSGASQFAMFKSGGVWYATFNGVAFVVGSGDSFTWGKDDGTQGSVAAGTPVGF